jgi:hypothetical protein
VRRQPCENDSNFIDAFDQDVKANREALRQKGKLEMPVRAVYGALSNTGAGVEKMMCELANRFFLFGSSIHGRSTLGRRGEPESICRLVYCHF